MRKIDTTYEGRPDRYLLLEAGELPEWAPKTRNKFLGNQSWTGVTYEKFIRCIATGDEELVAESEQFLSEIEDLVPVSQGWRNYDDVVGAIPNVPAFLAGHPQCMRRRQRTMKESAPIAIYMDLTSSGGISARDVMRRGVALLALTRLLVEHRSVDLWVGSSLGGGRNGGSGTVAWHIDTRPLDLARAAFHIGCTGMSRGFGYGLCNEVLGTGGTWPFNNYTYHCRTAKARVEAILDQEVLYIPPIMLDDELTRDPVGWVRRTLTEVMGSEEDE